MRSNSLKNQFYSLLKNNKKSLVYFAFGIYWLGLFIATSVPSETLPSVNVSDKIQHLTAYYFLSLLGGLTIHLQVKFQALKRKFYFSTILIFSIYGTIDEIHQLFIPGRFFDIADVAANLIGVILGALTLWLFFNKFMTGFGGTKTI